MRGLLLKYVQHVHDFAQPDGTNGAVCIAIDVVLQLEQTTEVTFQGRRVARMLSALNLVEREAKSLADVIRQRLKIRAR